MEVPGPSAGRADQAGTRRVEAPAAFGRRGGAAAGPGDRRRAPTCGPPGGTGGAAPTGGSGSARRDAADEGAEKWLKIIRGGAAVRGRGRIPPAGLGGQGVGRRSGRAGGCPEGRWAGRRRVGTVRSAWPRGLAGRA